MLAALSLAFVSCARRADVVPAGEVPPAEPPFRMALVCPSSYRVPDWFPAGMVLRIDRDGSLDETVRGAARAALDEASVRALVVVPAPAGTVRLFSELLEAKPGALLVAVNPAEDAYAIESVAGLVLESDAALIAYGSVRAAAEMGARQFVSVRLARSPADAPPGLARRFAVEAAAAEAAGIGYLAMTASGADRAAAAAGLPGLVADAAAKAADKAGSMAFGTAERELARPLLEAAMDAGMLYAEGEPPVTGYAGYAWNPAAYIAEAENVAGQRGTYGKALIWPWSRPEVLAFGTLEHLRRVIAGDSRLDDIEAVKAAFLSIWPAGAWNFAWFQDPASGVRARSHFLASGDAYLLGRGYLPSARQKFDEKLRILSVP